VLRAAAIAVLLVLNLIFWGTPILLGGVVKLLTFGEARRRVIMVLVWLAERWALFTNGIFDLLLDTRWHIEGDQDFDRDGHYLIVSNHVSWVDIFAVLRVFVGKGPFIRFFLKRALIWSPIVGQACWALEFPFMRRYSPEYLAQHPEKRGRDLETTRIACRRYRKIPVSIVNFIEGTRYSEEKHEDQQSPYRFLLRPRIGGISFVIASMAEQLDAMFDVSVIYPTRDISMWQFITNRLPWVEVRVRRIEIPREYLSAAITEPGELRDRFKAWVEEIWREKDRIMAAVLD
jgi:1-acyl-sn-glycerol-3-phosphate acyltransferase